MTRKRAAWGLAGVSAMLFAGLLVTAHRRAILAAPAPTLILRDRHGVFLAETGTVRDAQF